MYVPVSLVPSLIPSFYHLQVEKKLGEAWERGYVHVPVAFQDEFYCMEEETRSSLEPLVLPGAYELPRAENKLLVLLLPPLSPNKDK